MKLATFLLFILLFYLLLPHPQTQELDLTQSSIEVFVTGEVMESKNITMHPTAQIKDVLKQVELTTEADVSVLNLNEPLYDDMVIRISPQKKQECISINSADINLLITLDSIGPSTAQNIINYRNDVGPFIIIEDLLNVKNIGHKKFEKIRDRICL